MHSGQPQQLSTLTEEIAVDSIRDFFRDKPFLFFGTGMSCALDPRFGMATLKDELVQRIGELTLAAEQHRQWQQVSQSLSGGADLESSLDGVTDSELLQRITEITGRFIATLDREYALRISSGEIAWPATNFVKRLVDTLPEGDRILHALTPNYDLLFEYACDSVGIRYTSGFFGGVERRTNWAAVDQSLHVQEEVCQRAKLVTLFKYCKHVRLYKVHGSLNYFFHRNEVVENDSWMWSPPDFVQRVMITPGFSKYETLQRYRQELLRSADAAIEKASRFLFLGYGFNDKHLDEYIKRKLITQGCRGLIITRDSNPRIEALLADASNLWLVCKAATEGKDGTRIFNRQYAGWLDLPARRLWDIVEFTAQMFGG
ncbi:MAG TPA: SIR2 family protein [bacterium]